MKIELNIPTENYNEFLLISKLLQDLIHFKAEKISINCSEIEIDYILKPKNPKEVNTTPKTGLTEEVKYRTWDEPPKKKITIEKEIIIKKKRGRPKKKKRNTKRKPKTGLQKDFKNYQRKCRGCKQLKPSNEVRYGYCQNCRSKT